MRFLKITIYLLLFSLFSNASWAGHISVNKAKSLASNFYWERMPHQNGILINEIPLVLYETITEQDEDLFYIFNLKSSPGYIIIAADDDAYPILSYSFTVHFQSDNLAPATQEFLESYKNQLLEIIHKPLKADGKIKQAWKDLEQRQGSNKEAKDVLPLLSTTWSQGLYYNTDCPVDAAGPDGHALVGCVATAMIQIMKYHAYPPQGTGSHSYYHPDYGTISADFGNSTYDWASMPNNASSYNSALALASFHCGVSVEMDYGPNASGAYTFDVVNALETYFDYSTTAQQIQLDDYSMSEWENILRAELDNARPMEYRGHGPDGGHAFVLDGYQGSSDNHFHINWGWGGSSDGYYYLSNLNPGSYTFNEGQAVIIGIEPNGIVNHTPIVVNPINDLNLTQGFANYSIDISNVFSDADDDILSYSVTSSNTAVVGATLSGTSLNINEIGLGSSNITLTANDGNGGTASDIFLVSVSLGNFAPPSNLQVSESAYAMWDAPETFDPLWLQYDNGTNTDGIGGPAEYTVAAKWDISQLAGLDGTSITKIKFFPRDVATTIILKIWKGNNAAELIFQQTLSSINYEEWNEVTLSTPVSIDNNQQLWVGYYVETSGYTAGCGDYSGNPNSDYISTDGGASWTHLSEYDLNFSWNLAAYVENAKGKSMTLPSNITSKKKNSTMVKAGHLTPSPFAIDESKTNTNNLTGYHVYLNDALVTTTSNTYWQFTGLTNGNNYTAGVSAVYDNGESVIIEYDFTYSVNSAPTVVNPLPDLNLDEGFTTYQINISGVFSDPDGDALTYSVQSSNTAVVSVSLSGTTLNIYEAGVGNANITLTADDGNGESVDDVFLVSVNAATNNAPTVVNPISDLELDEGFGSYDIDITNVFNDVDGDALTFSVQSDNTAVIVPTISGNTLTLTENGVGSASITLTASDGNGGAANDIFLVDVIAAANSLPYVANPLPDLELDEGFNTYEIDIADVFNDADGDVLSYTVQSDNTTVISPTISGTTLILTEIGVGSAHITLTANDGNGGSVDDIFLVSVNAATNNVPVVVNALIDIQLDEGFGYYNVDFSNVFNDPDGDALSYSVESNNPSVLLATISGSNIILTEVNPGEADITLTANDGNGGVASDIFNVYINPIDATSVLTENDIHLFPNPSSGKVQISLTQMHQLLRIKVYDFTGKLLLEKQWISSEKNILDLSHFGSGVYFIKISTPYGERIKKLVLE